MAGWRIWRSREDMAELVANGTWANQTTWEAALLKAPMVIRFQDLLRHRVQTVNEAFAEAICDITIGEFGAAWVRVKVVKPQKFPDLAAVGVQFSQVPVEDIVSTLYDATITFRPDETLTLRGGLATSIDAPGPNASAAAKVDYAATGTLVTRYVISKSLKLLGLMPLIRQTAVLNW